MGVGSSSTARQEPFCAGGTSPDSSLTSAWIQGYLHYTWVIIQHLNDFFAQIVPALAAGSFYSAAVSLCPTLSLWVFFFFFLAFPPGWCWKIP